MKPSHLPLPATLIALLFSALAACGQGGGSGGTAIEIDQSAIKDMTLGDANAPVTLVEYASWTCPACEDFHTDVMPMVKSEYVETGKVRFVFREKPTPPLETAIAGFVTARCAGEARYFDVIDELFMRQTGITALARNGDQVTAALRQVAKNHGIETAEAFDACQDNLDIRRALAASKALGDANNVTQTPTVFVNGKRLTGSDWRYPEGMREVLEEALSLAAPVIQPDAVEAVEPDTAIVEPESAAEALEEAASDAVKAIDAVAEPVAE